MSMSSNWSSRAPAESENVFLEPGPGLLECLSRRPMSVVVFEDVDLPGVGGDRPGQGNPRLGVEAVPCPVQDRSRRDQRQDVVAVEVGAYIAEVPRIPPVGVVPAESELVSDAG